MTTHALFRVAAALALLAAAGLSNCASQPEPLVVSAASQAGYAERYPSALNRIATQSRQREREARTVLEEVPGYASELSSPNWTHVHTILDQADHAGRSAAYADRMREVRHVHSFFNAEKNDVGQKAGGAAQYAANQGGCDVMVGGAVAPALKKAVDVELEKRLRESNEAHRLLERYRTSLGELNARKLETQIDHLSYASFVTHIEFAQLRDQLAAMVEEADQVKATTDQAIADEQGYQSARGRTPGERAASRARVAALQRSKAGADAGVQAARRDLETMDARLEKLAEDYDYIVGAMKLELRRRAGNK
ncbi:MAG: hypothetical protein MUF54_04765 [Polyangiaceae bacterium]|jgi:hypothetical protein|nr:hypothetical protein [Polyangiaceae bacterium]